MATSGSFRPPPWTGSCQEDWTGRSHAANAIAQQARLDLLAAHDDAASRVPVAIVEGGALGGTTLVAGVYSAAGVRLDLTGTVTLDGQGDQDAVWIFQATSDLLTAGSSSVTLVNGAQACNVFWQVTRSATLGADSHFAGTLMARDSITLHSRVTLTGRVLAGKGGVTLMNDRISYPTCAVRADQAPPAAQPIAPPTTSPRTGPPVLTVVAMTSDPAAGFDPRPGRGMGATADSAAAISPIVVLGIVVSLGSIVMVRGRRWLMGDSTG